MKGQVDESSFARTAWSRQGNAGQAHYGPLQYTSTGDMLRAAASAETNIGKKVKETMASGKLVPDPLVLAAVIERIAQSDARHGFVLDGFPRAISQAVTFDDLLHTEGRASKVR